MPSDPQALRGATPRLLAVALAGALVTALAVPALAVNVDHGAQVVGTNPADNTPHVMNGSVNAITQIGNKIIAAGTFTSVSPAGTFANTGDDLVRNRIFAFDATTGEIDRTFNPNLGGAANSLDTDGTSIYVGGSFGSVSGSTAVKRVVKLNAAGVVQTGFKAVPNAAVNEVVVRGGRLYVGGSFKSVKRGTVTTARGALAALDPATGAVLPAVDVPFTGLYNGGGTNIQRFDVSADGSRLVAVGNFTTVGGEPREQLAVLDTSGTAALSSWSTDGYSRARNGGCASAFDTFMRDVDFSPAGDWFAVTTTGAFAGGASSGTLCDTTARWEMRDGGGSQPTWADYSGGDTTYGVAVTGSAVYVGGHMRWQNNSFQGDQAGPGAVPREGIAALDPVNGLPLSWNPGRSRGVGAQALLATSQGLWVGSDTTRLGRETHGRIGFLPLAGGKTVPVVRPSTLPGNLFLAERTATTGGGVQHRVNAGGPALQASDRGPDWTTDAGLVNGGNTGANGPAVGDATLPQGTPPDLFSSERWGEQDYDLPVAAGEQVTVRLYFANTYDGTAAPGSRVFDVLVEGEVVLDDFDIAAAVGHRVGTMREFTVTSDGTVDVDLRGVVENPLINGIEVVGDGASSPAPAPGRLLERPVDSAGAPTGPATTASTAFDWSTVRGAFVVNGTVYYGLGDGGLYARTFTAGTGAVGSAQRTVNLYDDPETGERIPFSIANSTGMAYDTATHRLYYTLFGDGSLYYRYFTPESEVVGAQTFRADGGGVDLSDAAGLALAGGKLLYGSRSDGSLRSVSFAGGAVTGSPTVVSDDGSWKHRAILVPSG